MCNVLFFFWLCREVLRTATCSADGPVTCFTIDKEWVWHLWLSENMRGFVPLFTLKHRVVCGWIKGGLLSFLECLKRRFPSSTWSFLMSKFCKIKLGSLVSSRGRTRFCLFPAPKCCRRPALRPSPGQWLTSWQSGRPLKHVCHTNVKAEWANSPVSPLVPVPPWSLRIWFLCCIRRAGIRGIRSHWESEGLVALNWWVFYHICLFGSFGTYTISPGRGRQAVAAQKLLQGL